jgi:multidrug efflux pump subunit AcrB
LLLKGHHDKKDILTKAWMLLLGWFFRPFNRFFEWSSNVYVGIVKRTIRFSIIALMIYGGLVWATMKRFPNRAGRFRAWQDKQYLVGFAQLPEGSSLDRTDDVMRRMSEIAMNHPGVKDAIAFPGFAFTDSAPARMRHRFRRSETSKTHHARVKRRSHRRCAQRQIHGDSGCDGARVARRRPSMASARRAASS